MDKRKINQSKITGKVPPGDNNPMLPVIIHVLEADYVPAWLSLRKRITAHIFTADVAKADLPKLEADEQVTSVAISEPLDLL